MGKSGDYRKGNNISMLFFLKTLLDLNVYSNFSVRIEKRKI